MSSDANDARLAHAKKLLTKFQNRRNMNEMLDVEVVSTSAIAEPFNGSQPASIDTPSMERSLHSSRSSSFVNVDQAGFSHDQNGLTASPSEIHSLRQALAEKEHHLNSTMTKLQALHGHYADLHQAYNELKAKQPDNSEFSQQICQLQTALALAVNEKTQLQSELRSATGHQKALETEIDFLKAQNHGTITSAQLLSHQAENQKLGETVANQSATIAQQRAECADLEARIVVLNQDKNDIQARLKFVYQEKDEISARLNELKNELNIKEIYIRQLAKHSSADSTQGQQTIQTLTEQKNFFENECQRYSRDIAMLKNEYDTSKCQYEECLAQSRAHASTLEQTIEQLTNQKRQLEFSKFCLEEELQLLRKNAQENLEQVTEKVEDQNAKNATAEARPECNQFDYDALNNSYQKMEVEFQKQIVLMGQLNAAMEEKDLQNNRLNHQVEDQEHKIQRLEAQIQHLKQMDSDVHQLSAQLQNERATVSRAVSQNMELKSQFGEIQDKLIQMTNEYAQAEDEKSNALSLVAKLSRKIEELESGHTPPPENAPVYAEAPIVPKSQRDGITQTEQLTSSLPEIERRVGRPNALNYSHIANVQYPINALHPDTKIPIPNREPIEHPEPSSTQRNDSQSTDQYEPQTASTTPDTVEISTLQQHSHELEEDRTDDSSATEALEENDDQEQLEAVRDFLTNPKSSDSAFTRQLRNTFIKLNSNIGELRKKVETLEKLNDEYQQANSRLQYWLTAVESENESIGDFIELYRMQRAQIQARVTEKEEECDELRRIHDLLENRLKLLHSSLLTFLKKSQRISDIDEVAQVADEEQAAEAPTNNCDIHELMALLVQIRNEKNSEDRDARLQQLTHTLQSAAIHFDPKLHCSECRGEMYDL